MKSEERLMCSALWYCDDKQYEGQPINIESGFVVCGHRHHNCFATLVATMGYGNYTKSLITQGFLTTHNIFLNRKRSKELAIRIGQVGNGHNGRLYSEDLK